MNIDLTINTDLARKILTGFIRSEITRAGFGTRVIGLSGGLDSALSCALAVEALGPQNVLARAPAIQVVVARFAGRCPNHRGAAGRAV